MQRWKLQKGCLFVDAYDLDNSSLEKFIRYPTAIPYAHVLDKRKKTTKDSQNCNYTIFSDLAGFIGRFIVMGVDTDFILPQIVASEFGLDAEKAANEVKITLNVMKKYLEPLTYPRPGLDNTIDGRHRVQNGVLPECGYELDFKVNPMGIGIFKG